MKNHFLKSLILLFFITIVSLETNASAKIHFINNYTTAGYSIIPIGNSGNFALVGTVYKTPILTSCSYADNSDIHFLIVDGDGNIMSSRFFDTEFNDIAYDITLYNSDPNNPEFLITGAMQSDDLTCQTVSPFIVGGSTQYIIVDQNGNIINSAGVPFNNLNYLFCSNNSFSNDGRSFQSVVTTDGIFSVGVNSIEATLEPNVNRRNKIGVLRMLDQQLNPQWEVAINHNDPGINCNSDDYDLLTNITDVPGIGIFVAGTVTVQKQITNTVEQGAVLMLFDYSGNLLFDWSEYNSDNMLGGVVPADCIYSETSGLIYVISNDYSDNTHILLGLDPNSGTISMDKRLANSNPDAFMPAYKINEPVDRSDIILVSGMSDQINPNGPVLSGMAWAPFIYETEKMSNPPSTILQLGGINNTGQNLEGEEYTKTANKKPKYYTPRITAYYDKNAGHYNDAMTIGYEFNSTSNEFGLILMNTFLNNMNYDNCETTTYESMEHETPIRTPANTIQIMTSAPDPFQITYVDPNPTINSTECNGFNGSLSPVYEEVATNNKNVSDNIKIYPNPASNLATLSFDNNEIKQFELSIYDVLGKVIFKESIQLYHGANQYRWENNLDLKGLCIFKIQTDNSEILKSELVRFE